jgi:hypothetical protein
MRFFQPDIQKRKRFGACGLFRFRCLPELRQSGKSALRLTCLYQSVSLRRLVRPYINQTKSKSQKGGGVQLYIGNAGDCQTFILDAAPKLPGLHLSAIQIVRSYSPLSLVNKTSGAASFSNQSLRTAISSYLTHAL